MLVLGKAIIGYTAIATATRKRSGTIARRCRRDLALIRSLGYDDGPRRPSSCSMLEAGGPASNAGTAAADSAPFILNLTSADAVLSGEVFIPVFTSPLIVTISALYSES